MKRQSGFTFIELILTMVLSAILAGIVIEMIAGPIRAYFWYTQRSLYVDMAQTSIDSIQNDLNNSLPNSLIVNSQPEKKEILFRNILYTGVWLPETNTQLPQKLLHEQQERVLFIVFPHSGDQGKLYPYTLVKTDNARIIKLQESPPDLHKPQPYYIVTSLHKYECVQESHTLERTATLNESASQTSLISNQVSDCQFSLLQGQPKALLVSFSFGQGKSRVKLTQPLYFGKSYDW